VPPIDPQALIKQNADMNRVNVSTPFGSQMYVTGPDGKQTLQTTLSPEMQALFTQQMAKASAPAAHYSQPAGQSDLLAQLIAQQNARYKTPGG
jgi:hypothetical protein